MLSDKTLERFDFSHSPSVNHALIAELATCGFIAEKAPVLIAGPTGTGKSHLAQEQLLVSGDRPFSSMLKLAVDIQMRGNLDALYPFLGESKDAVTEMALRPNSQKMERVYGSEQWGPEYRANLIKEFEAKLRVHKT
jgi:hypothetical protein